MGPNSGPGREPQRTMNVEQMQGGNPAYPNPSGPTTVFEPGQPGQPLTALNRPQMSQSPPPANPGQAQQQLETQADTGRLVNEIGELKELMRLEQEKHRLQTQALMAGLQARQAPLAGHTPAPGSAEFDPNSPVTLGTLRGILASIAPDFQSTAIRGAWDVTADEEKQALEQNPALAFLPEPVKTTQIRQTVDFIRRQNQRSNAAPSQQVSPQPNPQQQGPALPARPTVAHQQFEQPSAPTQTGYGPETPGAQNDVQAAIAEYDRLKIQELPRARTKAEKSRILGLMKAEMRKAQFGQGISDEVLSKQSFVQGGGPS